EIPQREPGSGCIPGAPCGRARIEHTQARLTAVLPAATLRGHAATPPQAQTALEHPAMNSGLATDTGKEASIRSGSTHGQTEAKFGRHLAPCRDCNLHSSRAQFAQGANRVFYLQIGAS